MPVCFHMYFFVCVQSLKPELEGTYVCKAANKLGQIETAFQVPGFIKYILYILMQAFNKLGQRETAFQVPGFIENMRYMIHPHARLLTSWDRERQP